MNKKKTGIVLLAEYVGMDAQPDARGYVNVYLSTNRKYAPHAFSLQAVSEELTAFTEIPEGSYVQVETSTPLMRTSKAGNRYLSWFLTGLPIVREEVGA